MGPLGKWLGVSNAELMRQLPMVYQLDMVHWQFAPLSIYLPRVTWVEHDTMGHTRRRELAYDSDILERIDWQHLNVEALAQDWAPDAPGPLGTTLHLGLELLRAQAQNPVADRLPHGSWTVPAWCAA